MDRGDDFREDRQWLRERWAAARVLALDPEGRLLADARRRPRWLDARSLPATAFDEACYLGTIDDAAVFALVQHRASPGTEGRWLNIRSIAAEWPAHEAGLAAYARALVLWRARHLYCGRCGRATQFARAGHSVRCSDTACGLEQFPRVDPAVIMLVVDDSRCLLGRQAAWPPRRWSTLAGFVEPGESLEDAVRREIGEEAGVQVGRCDYQSSQPWPFPHSLMVGFRATAASTGIVRGDELQDVRWFEADALLAGLLRGELLLPSRYSISHRLIEEWLAERCDAGALAQVLAQASD
ncbi:MAG TPA: NAD(+) diphosphatase [Xanthomonadaceae bacterium]|nr:NAD(+) diphosphatase [Xanthomonadaceae bacterium]